MVETPPIALSALGAPLARGRTAMLYAWDATHVLKLFWQDAPLRSVEYEADVASRVHATGLRVPAVGPLVQIEERFGIVYERVDGQRLTQRLTAQPWRFGAVTRQLAALHAALHNQSASTLPAKRNRLVRQINCAIPLTAAMRQKALVALERLADGDQLCHGDFHPDNVLLTDAGPVVIDWTDATRGNPLADVARTLVLLRFGVRPAARLQRWGVQFALLVMRTTYLRHYRRLRPIDPGELHGWLIPIVAARLSENVTNEEPYLLRYLERLLENDE